MSAVIERHEHKAPDPRAALVRLAPDLTKVAYVVEPEEPPYDEEPAPAEGDGGDDPNEEGGLYVAAPGAEPVRWLALRHPWRVEEVGWSSEGHSLACVLCHDTLEAPERFVAWLDGPGEERGRVPGHAFAWTPKAKALVVADVRGGELRRVNAEGGAGEPLCPLLDDGHGSFPPRIAMAPNGKRLAFSCRRFSEGLSEVWIVEGRGAEPRLLTQIPGAQLHAMPFWSPGGGSLGLYLVHLQQRKTGIVLVPQLQGEGEIVYESDEIDPPVTPCWSPSSSSVVFFRAVADETIRLVALDCRNRVELELESDMNVGHMRFVDERRLAIDGGAAARVLELETVL